MSDFVDYCPFLTSGAPVTDAPPPAVGASRIGFAWVGPVPARADVTVMLGLPSDGPGTLEFVDPSGRIVRRMSVLGAAGTRAVLRWDFTDERGGRVAPGIYFARYRHQGLTEVRRVVLTP